jgi:hypothetical protein
MTKARMKDEGRRMKVSRILSSRPESLFGRRLSLILDPSSLLSFRLHPSSFILTF